MPGSTCILSPQAHRQTQTHTHTHAHCATWSISFQPGKLDDRQQQWLMAASMSSSSTTLTSSQAQNTQLGMSSPRSTDTRSHLSAAQYPLAKTDHLSSLH